MKIEIETRPLEHSPATECKIKYNNRIVRTLLPVDVTDEEILKKAGSLLIEYGGKLDSKMEARITFEKG